jgi:hypothetical protein
VQDGGDGPVALSLHSQIRKEEKHPVRANSVIDEGGRTGRARKEWD